MNRGLMLATLVFFGISIVAIFFFVYRGVSKPQNAVPSKADTGTTTGTNAGPADVTKCQGNSNPSAKCFKCEPKNKNSPVNILDFACFQKFYGQNVGIGSAVPTPGLTKNVQLLIYNPVLTSQNNQKLVAYKSWNDPTALTNQIISDMKTVSGNFVNYQIVETKDINDIPVKADGFKYTESAYLSCLSNSANCHSPDGVDYKKILSDNQSCEKRNNGTIDEVWLWGGLYFGYWEAVMTGPNAFNTNAPPITGTTCQKQLNIMGFNYERGIPEALEDFGHRVEGTMTQVYGGWTQGGTTTWDRYTAYDKVAPRRANCGDVHYAPNSLSDYDWSNTRTVQSACDDWLNYPSLPSSPNYKSVSCTTWNCDDYQYKKWWLSHLPKKDGSSDGRLNNWWRYVVDFENTQ